VSKILSGETITCASCEYRYPPSEGTCPMCGTEPLGPVWAVPSRFSRASHGVGRPSSDSQQRPPKPRLRRLIPVVVILVALMAVTSFFYTSHNNAPPKESRAGAERTAASLKVNLENAGDQHIIRDPVKGVQHVVARKLGTTTLAATSEQTKVENATERDIVHDPVGGVHHAVAGKLGTAQKVNAVKENDPVALWKAVKRGSVNAEVALGNLYLEGEAVPQNCEQAHMLLSAASMKGSKAADNFLKTSYAERCE
jgi:hypothetical protein